MTKATVTLGKAELLRFLQGRLSRSRLLPQSIIDFNTFEQSFEAWWNAAPSWTHSRQLMVRSNHVHEALGQPSFSGCYLSVPDVSPDSASVEAALRSVFDSYGEPASGDSLFIQPMITTARWCGVISFRDRQNGAPYMLIEESAGSATNRITGGKQGQISLSRWLNDCPPKGVPSARHRLLVDALLEVAGIIGTKELELEYAFDHALLPIVLQVRGLASGNFALADQAFSEQLEVVHSHLVALFDDGAPVSPNRIYSVMADWNPIEILGRKPRPLALSLYGFFFTERIWTEARQVMGYADPGPGPLMHVVGGTPFIDVTQSFRSLLPASITPDEADAIVIPCLQDLRASPEHHDSVELRVIPNSYTATTFQALAQLNTKGVSHNLLQKLSSGLKTLTDGVFRPGGYLDTENDVLQEWVVRSLDSKTPVKPSVVHLNRHLAWLRQIGAPLFVRLARCAYMAVAQLEALVQRGVLDKPVYDAFFRSLQTVPSQLKAFNGDRWRMQLEHLRPSTYDIESPCWRDRPDWMRLLGNDDSSNVPDFALTRKQQDAIQSLLINLDWDIDAKFLFRQCAKAIEGRELGKFLFSRYLSSTLEIIASLCAGLGLSRRQVSMLNLEQITRALGQEQSPAVMNALINSSAASEQLYAGLRRVALPDVLVHPDQVYGYTQSTSPAHFMGAGVIEGKPLVFDKTRKQPLEGAIVALGSADPGFDFLFHSRIAGLVTCYGGVNSHMAVRCKESGIPGVLGVGPEIYQRLIKASHVVIDLNVSQLILAPGN